MYLNCIIFEMNFLSSKSTLEANKCEECATTSDLPTLTVWPRDSRFGMPNTALPLNLTVDHNMSRGCLSAPTILPTTRGSHIFYLYFWSLQVWGPNLQVFLGFFFQNLQICMLLGNGLFHGRSVTWKWPPLLVTSLHWSHHVDRKALVTSLVCFCTALGSCLVAVNFFRENEFLYKGRNVTISKTWKFLILVYLVCNFAAHLQSD